MNEKLRVLVIFGGRSGEHEVSLMSARAVLAALDPEKYTVYQVGITHGGAWLTGENVLDVFNSGQYGRLLPAVILPSPAHPGLYSLESGLDGNALRIVSLIDVVFPVLHGTFGEDGSIQGLFEMAGMAYVGAGVLGSALGMDKGVFKDVMRARHIPVLENIVVLRSDIQERMDEVIYQAEKVSAYPLFIKPANLGSSVGISKCTSRSDLVEGLLEAARYDRRVLIERGISAREIEISVLGNENPEASMPGEIIPSREFYSYEAKYIDNRSEIVIPAPLDSAQIEMLRKMAVQIYQAVDCAGMARVDFLQDKKTGEFFVSEINTIPGFTQISMYAKLWQADGISYSMLVDRLIELAMARFNERIHTEWQYKA